MREIVSVSKQAYLSTYKPRVEKVVPKAIYREIVNKFFKLAMQKMFDGHSILLAEVGEMVILGKKVEPVVRENGVVAGLAPNWAPTKKYYTEKAQEMGITFDEFVKTVPQSERPLIYCFNEHSNGMMYKLLWLREEVKIKNKSLYSFRFSRNNKRTLSKLVQEGAEYIETKNF